MLIEETKGYKYHQELRSHPTTSSRFFLAVLVFVFFMAAAFCIGGAFQTYENIKLSSSSPLYMGN